MAITGVFVRHALSGLYTSCAPRISMNEYNITESVLLLHSSFKTELPKLLQNSYTFLPKQESRGEYTHSTNTLPVYSNKVDLDISDMISMRLGYS